MKSKFIVGDGEFAVKIDPQVRDINLNGFRSSMSGMFLREFGVSAAEDFDLMCDRVILFSRTEPHASLTRSGFSFKKRAVCFDMPPRGTAERDGADMVLAALCDFLEDHEE